MRSPKEVILDALGREIGIIQDDIARAEQEAKRLSYPYMNEYVRDHLKAESNEWLEAKRTLRKEITSALEWMNSHE